MTFGRYLDYFERQLMTDTPLLGVEYEGEVDETALLRALKLLYARHPILAGRIRSDEKGSYLYVPPDYEPQLIVLDGDESTLMRQAKRPWDSRTALSRIILIRGRRCGYLAMRVDHAVFDGTSLMEIFRDLWHFYTDIAAGKPIKSNSSQSLPVPPSEVMRNHPELRSLLPSWSEEEIHCDNQLSPQRQVDLIQGRIHLSRSETGGLIAKSRQLNLSVYALVCGALLKAQHTFGDCDAESTPMVCFTPVNLRTRVSPPVGPTETTSLLGIHRANVAVPRNAKAAIIGRGVKEQLDAAVRGRQLALVVEWERISKPFASSISRRLSSLTINNMGRISPFPQPAELRIVGIRTPAATMSNSFPHYGVYTYDGELVIRFVYPSNVFAKDEASRLVELCTSQLMSTFANSQRMIGY